MGFKIYILGHLVAALVNLDFETKICYQLNELYTFETII